MRRHLVRPAAVAAALLTAAAVCAAASAGSGAAAAATTAPAPGQPAAARPVFLINGAQLGADAPAQPGPCTFVFSFVAQARTAQQVQMVTIGDTTYALPVAALPYLGHGLDPSLFDVTALAAAESGGRLPVRVGYAGRLPALPGVTITAARGGTAAGYLTPAGASRFGAALARQFAADHDRGSYGQDGMFAGGTSVALAGSPAVTPRPGYVLHTLTVDGTNLAGKPDSGDPVWVFNADDANRFDDPLESESVFDHGTAKFSVPAGHYWAVGDFFSQVPGQSTFSERLDVLPEFTARSHTTIRLAAAAASSKLQMITARPAEVQDVSLSLVRTSASGPAVTFDWLNLTGGPHSPGPSLYVSPTRAPPATGTLTDLSAAQLGSPAGAPGTPYVYALAYRSRGIIPDQRFVPAQARLATENASFYSAVPVTAVIGRIPVFPQDEACYGGGLFPTRLPARQTAYLSASPSLLWQEQYFRSGRLFGSGGQAGAPRAFLPGSHLTEEWGDYPLHPAPDVRLVQVSGEPPTIVSASRAGNKLGLYLLAFSDNVPGHATTGVFPPARAAGSYQIEQDGVKIAGGSLRPFYGYFLAQAALPPARSQVRLSLTAAEPATVNPLSTRTQTVWTWWSSHAAGATLPPGWVCAPGLAPQGCSPQPMMTLRYGVVGLRLDGSASAGQQVVRITVGHIQLARAPKITGVKVSASFDGGRTWRGAPVTGAGGSYAAVFTAPAGALITLRTSAADAGGGSVSETITDAYRVAA